MNNEWKVTPQNLLEKEMKDAILLENSSRTNFSKLKITFMELLKNQMKKNNLILAETHKNIQFKILAVKKLSASYGIIDNTL